MTSPLFDDPHAEARMRALIPRLALLGCLVYAVVGVLQGGFGGRWVGLTVLIVGGLALTGVVARFELAHRAPPSVIYLALLGYCAIIAVPLDPESGIHPLDEVFGLLPVFFAAIFFQSWVRYAFAVNAALVHYALQILAGTDDVQLFVERLLGYLVAALLAAQVSDTLREALRRNESLHTVLRAANADPSGDTVAGDGLEAALQVLDWELGAVLVLEGTDLRLVAEHGPVGRRGALLDSAPLLGLCAEVMGRDDAAFIDALPARLGGGHGLVMAGARCLTAAPIRYRDEVIGVLLAASRSDRRWSADEARRVIQVADQLGLAIGAVAAYRQEVAVAEGLRALAQRKDDFVANVSHELRTPLTSIRLAARTLLVGWDRLERDRIRVTLESVQERALELSELVESLLAEAVADGGRTRLALVPLEWEPALNRWVASFEERSGRTVEVTLPQRAVMTIADPAKVERIVTNLLDNAAKFSDASSRLQVRLDTDHAGVRVAVTDQGIGIEPSVLPLVFDRFFQADASSTRAAGGIGIGLSLVCHFVRAHGGEVDVRSEVGTGSTFTVRLPWQPPGSHDEARVAVARPRKPEPSEEVRTRLGPV